MEDSRSSRSDVRENYSWRRSRSLRICWSSKNVGLVLTCVNREVNLFISRLRAAFSHNEGYVMIGKQQPKTTLYQPELSGHQSWLSKVLQNRFSQLQNFENFEEEPVGSQKINLEDYQVKRQPKHGPSDCAPNLNATFKALFPSSSAGFRATHRPSESGFRAGSRQILSTGFKTKLSQAWLHNRQAFKAAPFKKKLAILKNRWFNNLIISLILRVFLEF